MVRWLLIGFAFIALIAIAAFAVMQYVIWQNAD